MSSDNNLSLLPKKVKTALIIALFSYFFALLVDILGVKFFTGGQKSAISFCRKAYKDNHSKTTLIFTPNPEMLVEAYQHDFFRSVLNQADLNLPDGFGLKLATPFLKRVAGADFAFSLCGLVSESRGSVFLLGTGESEVLERAKDFLQKNFPGLKVFVHPGLVVDLMPEGRVRYDVDENLKILEIIKESRPDLLLVAFGARKQEIWLVDNQVALRNCGVKLAVGVGGTLDFWSGRLRRAPYFLRLIGLEWFWRLVLEPKKRARRIWRAVFIFPFLYFKSFFVRSR